MTSSLKALQLKAKHQVYTLLSGHNLSRLHGEGYDFSELREYQMGDDIRKINWTITAKLGKPYIKKLHSNRELSVVVATLMDGSVYFDQTNQKQQTITEIATLLAYATQQNQDLFQGISFTPHKVFTSPPTKEIYHIEKFSESLYKVALLDTKLDYRQSLKSLFQQIHKPSLLFIVSDFLEKMDLSLLAQKHEVIAVIVRDEKEDSPGKRGEIILQNPTNADTMETYFAEKSLVSYRGKLQEHDKRFKEHLTRYDIRSVKIVSNEAPIEKLLKLFR